MQKHTCKLWAGNPGTASLDGDSPTTDLTYKPLPCRAEWRCGSVEGMFDSPFGTGGSSPVPFGERGEISDWSAHDRSSFQSESPARTGRHSQGQKENKSLSLTEVHVPSQIVREMNRYIIFSRHPKSVERMMHTGKKATGAVKARTVATPFCRDVVTVILSFMSRGEWLYVWLTGDVTNDWMDFAPTTNCCKHVVLYRPPFPHARTECGCLMKNQCHACCVYHDDVRGFDRIHTSAEIRLLLIAAGVEQNPGPLPGIMVVEIVGAIRDETEKERTPSTDEIQIQLNRGGVERNPGPPKFAPKPPAKKQKWVAKEAPKSATPPEEMSGPKTYAEVVATPAPPKVPRFIDAIIPSGIEVKPFEVVLFRSNHYIVDFNLKLRQFAYNLNFLEAAPGRVGVFTEDSLAALILAHSGIGAKSAHKIRVIPQPDLKTITIPDVLTPVCGNCDAGGDFVMTLKQGPAGYVFALTTHHARNQQVRKEMAGFFHPKPEHWVKDLQNEVYGKLVEDLTLSCPSSLKIFKNRFEVLFRPIAGEDVDESIPGPKKVAKVPHGPTCVCGMPSEDGLCDDCFDHYAQKASANARLRPMIEDSDTDEADDELRSCVDSQCSNDSFQTCSDGICLCGVESDVIPCLACSCSAAQQVSLPPSEIDPDEFSEAQRETFNRACTAVFHRNLPCAEVVYSSIHGPDFDDFSVCINHEKWARKYICRHEHHEWMKLQQTALKLEAEATRQHDVYLEMLYPEWLDHGYFVKKQRVLTQRRLHTMKYRNRVRVAHGIGPRDRPNRVPMVTCHDQQVATLTAARSVVEVSTQHHCSIFVMRWIFEYACRFQGLWDCPFPPLSRARIAAVLHEFDLFARRCMNQRARRNLGGVVATVDQHIRYFEANGTASTLTFKFRAFDLSTRELEDLCRVFKLSVNVPQPNSVFIELDASRYHCGIYQTPRDVRWYKLLRNNNIPWGRMHPIEASHRLANSFTVAPLTLVPLLIEDAVAPKTICDAVIEHYCPRHCGVFEDEAQRFSLKKLWNYERTVGNELAASKIMRKGIIGNIKYSLGRRPMERGFLRPQAMCTCLIDPISWLQTGHDTTSGPGIMTVQNPQIEALINRIVIPAAATEDKIARQAVIWSYLQRLVEKHPFDANGVCNVAMEHDPEALVRLCHDNTAMQLITRTVEYRAATFKKEPLMFRDIILDGRMCDVCPRTDTKCVNGVDLCAAHQLCESCGVLHEGPCASIKQQHRICGCGGYDCKKCRLFDGCYRCGMMVVSRFQGKKVQRYCPNCTHDSMKKISPHLTPIARRGIGVIMQTGVYPTKPFTLPRLPGLKQGSFHDPATELKALVDGKWIKVNDTSQLRDDDRCFRAGATLYGLGLSVSVPCVPVLTLKPLLHSMITRQLKDQPVAEPGYFARLEHFVRTNMEKIFGPAREIQPTPFEEWVSRFPPARQKQLRRALMLVRSGRFNLKRACERVIFGKNEKLEKGTYASTSDDFSCRVISSLAGYEASVILGPWMHAFGIELKRIFSRGTCMTTACGMDAAELGECFAEAASFENFMDGDHSKFDSTIHHRLLLIEHLVYRHFGLHRHKNAWRVLKHQLTSRFQIKMMIDGKIRPIAKGKYFGRRNSGDSNTTTGNTILNALCVIHAAFCASDFTDFDAFYQPHNFRAWVVGDDLMLACSSNVFSFRRFMEEHKASGLVLEHNLRDHPGKLTFCGSRSVPCFDGQRKTRLAIPQFERWGTKIGWSRDPQPSPEAYVYGLAQCWQSTLCEVPLFGDVLQRYHMLMEGRPETRGTYRIQEEIHNRKAIPFGMRRVITEEVVGDVAAGIGVTSEVIQIWRQMIGAVRSLPCIVALPGAELMFQSS